MEIVYPLWIAQLAIFMLKESAICVLKIVLNVINKHAIHVGMVSYYKVNVKVLVHQAISVLLQNDNVRLVLKIVLTVF